MLYFPWTVFAVCTVMQKINFSIVVMRFPETCSGLSSLARRMIFLSLLERRVRLS